MTVDVVGGIWTYSLELGRAMAAQGWQVTLAMVGPNADYNKQTMAKAAALDLVHLNAFPDWLASGPNEIARGGEALASLARRTRADLVHLNHPAFAALATFDAPVLALCHSCVATWWAAVKETPLPEALHWQATMVGQGYRASQALVAPSETFADAICRAYNLRAMPTVVHNGRRPIPLVGFDVPPNPSALTAGRLWDEGKDVATLDRAAALSATKIRAAGPVRGPNGATVAPAHLDLLGELSTARLQAMLAERPIYVSAARYEPFGLAVLEAAQAGCALVLSDIRSFRELWDGAAVFVPPGNAVGFAGAVDRLIAEPATRARSAAAATARAAHYGLDVQTSRMAAVYSALLDGAPSEGIRAV